MVSWLLVSTMLLQSQSAPIYLDPRAGEDSALVDISEFVGNYPRRVLQEYDQAIEDARRGDAAGAMARLEEVVKAVPEFYAANQNLGVLYQRDKRYRDAERQFQTARTLNPRSAAPLVHLGSLFVEEAGAAGTGDGPIDRSLLNTALEHLQQALKLQPSSGFAHYLTGIVYFQTSFYEAAEDHFQQALSGGRNMSFVRLAIANVHIRLQEWEAVIDQIDAYLRENPFARNRDQVREFRAGIVKKLEAPK
jgi:tetratricopeptide (TPR) repeat protein